MGPGGLRVERRREMGEFVTSYGVPLDCGWRILVFFSTMGRECIVRVLFWPVDAGEFGRGEMMTDRSEGMG